MRFGAHIKDEHNSTISYLISEITTHVFRVVPVADWSHTGVLFESIRGQVKDIFCWLPSPSFVPRNNFLCEAKVKTLTNAHARKVRVSKAERADRERKN